LWWTKWHWDRFFSELSVFGAPLIVKLGKKKLLNFITAVTQEALRLRCVRSICCGALYHEKTKGSSFSCEVLLQTVIGNRLFQPLSKTKPLTPSLLDPDIGEITL
jgi:hypothetical protein